MLHALKQLFHRPAIRMGRVDNSRIQTTRLRNAQFVSFFAENGNLGGFGGSDRYESRLRRRRYLKTALAIIVTAGAAWVVIESAQALSMF
jgi:hypothetical protein